MGNKVPKSVGNFNAANCQLPICPNCQTQSRPYNQKVWNSAKFLEFHVPCSLCTNFVLIYLLSCFRPFDRHLELWKVHFKRTGNPSLSPQTVSPGNVEDTHEDVCDSLGVELKWQPLQKKHATALDMSLNEWRPSAAVLVTKGHQIPSYPLQVGGCCPSQHHSTTHSRGISFQSTHPGLISCASLLFAYLIVQSFFFISFQE